MRVIRATHRFIRAYIPLFTRIVAALAFLIFLLGRIATHSAAFADRMNMTVCLFVRRVLASLSNAFPFSLAELLIFSVPLWLALFIFVAIRLYRNRRRGIRFLATVAGIVLLFYPFYVLTLGIGYHTSPIADRLGITREETVTTDDLERTLLTVRDALNAEVPGVAFADGGASQSPYTMDGTTAQILAAYLTVGEHYDAIPTFRSRAKAVMASEGMSYLRLLGIYTYFTGESNINTTFPDYTIPFTVAHEFAHQRGVIPENEANFVAFLVCIASEDTYVRYSGYLNMFEYLANALARADRDRLVSVYAGLDSRVLGDLRAYSEVYNRYADSTIGNISEKVNDTYLKNNGTAGVASYGLVVDLAVAYYKGQ